MLHIIMPPRSSGGLQVRAMSHMVTDILCLAAGGLRLALRLRTPEGFLSLSDALLEEVECYDAAACTDNTDPAGALASRCGPSRLQLLHSADHL